MNARGDEEFVLFATGAERDLHHLAWLLTGDSHRAEELVQDALVRTYTAWHRVRRDDPYGYTRRVLINAKTDIWRRRRRELLVNEVPESAVPVDLADAIGRRSAIVAALRTLPPREQAVVVLRYYVDLSEADTAAELGISVGTVKSSASRALAKLRVHAAHDDTAGADPGVLPVSPASEGARP